MTHDKQLTVNDERCPSRPHDRRRLPAQDQRPQERHDHANQADQPDKDTTWRGSLAHRHKHGGQHHRAAAAPFPAAPFPAAALRRTSPPRATPMRPPPPPPLHRHPPSPPP